MPQRFAEPLLPRPLVLPLKVHRRDRPQYVVKRHIQGRLRC